MPQEDRSSVKPESREPEGPVGHRHRITDVVQRDMCIGCGACQVATEGAVRVQLTPRGIYRARLDGATEQAIQVASRVCPFSDDSPNEDLLGAPQGTSRMVKDPMLGEVSTTWAGWVTDPDERVRSSSGGLTSWLLARVVAEGTVDAVISVGRQHRQGSELFDYGVAGPEDLHTLRKSQYYANSMAEVLSLIESAERRFAIVGIPCFIRAARALCIERPSLAERMTLFVSLVCGHYKTQAYADALAWQAGIHPDTLDRVDFRVKDLTAPASRYLFSAGARGSSEEITVASSSLRGTNWGLNAFQPEACNFCDDVVGETADISFGDAWLPRFVDDPLGTNVVVSRNETLDKILEGGAGRGEIALQPLTRTQVAASQAGGFRHRREGLAVRLADDIAVGYSVPRKRVDPRAISGLSERRIRLVRHRRRIAAESHEVFARAREADDVSLFTDWLDAQEKRYRKIEGSWVFRARRRLRGVAASVLRGLRRLGH